MKKLQFYVLITILVALLLIGCQDAPNDNNEKSPENPSTNKTTQSISSSPDETISESNQSHIQPNADNPSSNENKTPADNNKEKFIKICIGLDGLYALSNYNNVYHYCFEDKNLSLFMDHVTDLSEPYPGEMYFVRDGKLETLVESSVNFYEIENVQSVSGSVVITTANQAKYFYKDTWYDIDIAIDKVISTDIHAIILDDHNTLWAFQFENKALEKVADNVIDFDYSRASKIYHSNDIWYITSDNQLHVEQIPFALNTYVLPQTPPISQTIYKVVAESGAYLLQLQNGTYIYGDGSDANTQKVVLVQGIHQDIDISCYAIVDANGVIYYEQESFVLASGAEPSENISLQIQLP